MKSLQSVVALPSGKSRLRLKTGINLVEKPGSPLGLVDPVLDQAGCRDVVMPIADLMGRAQGTYQELVVGAKLGKHLLRIDKFLIVILQTSVLCNISNRMEGRSANFTDPFGHLICHRENLFTLFVQKQMIIPKMAGAHVPVEILCLHIQRKHVS